MSMSHPDTGEVAIVKRSMDRALLARAGIGMLSTYLVVVSFAWKGKDGYLFTAGWLPAQAVFLAAGTLGFPMMFWPKTRRGIVPWMAALGLACVGRTFTVLFGDYTFDERLRATGWITTWVLAMVAVLQIQASEILRRRDELWTG